MSDLSLLRIKWEVRTFPPRNAALPVPVIEMFEVAYRRRNYNQRDGVTYDNYQDPCDAIH